MLFRMQVVSVNIGSSELFRERVREYAVARRPPWHLYIRGEAGEGGWTLRIHDDGPGFEPARLAELLAQRRCTASATHAAGHRACNPCFQATDFIAKLMQHLKYEGARKSAGMIWLRS